MSTTESKLRQLKIVDLKELLAKKGLPVSGKKEELIFRILAAEANKPEGTNNNNINDNNNNNNMDIITTNIGFTETSQTALNTEPKGSETDLFDKDILVSPNELPTGLDDDWEKFTTDDIANLSKDSLFDSPDSPTSPSLSNKETLANKLKTEVSKDNLTTIDDKQKDSNTTIKDDATSSTTSSDILIKPSGFTCKKIIFDEKPSLPVSKSQPDLTAELERRKKRAERFGVQLSDADKKLQRAARFGINTKIPADSPLKAPLPSSGKLAVASIEDEGKLKKRTEKFALDKEQTNILNVIPSLSEEEKKKMRAEKFSKELASTPSNQSPLTSLSEEEKRKRRTERFALHNDNESPNKKLKT